MNVMPRKELRSAAEMEVRLREIGATRYHNLHPFHKLLHGGKLSKPQVQAWALNRYYYQSSVPIKDAVVLSRFRDRKLRQEWIHRISDHDGEIGGEGGIDRWLKLTTGLGLDPALVEFDRRHPAGHPLRRGRLCQFRPRAHPARGRRLVADRALRLEHPRGAHLRDARAL